MSVVLPTSMPSAVKARHTEATKAIQSVANQYEEKDQITLVVKKGKYVYFEPGKGNIRSSTVPGKKMKKSKDGKPYPEDIKFDGTIVSASPNELENKIRPRSDDQPGWEVWCKHTGMSDKVKAYLLDHLTAIYDKSFSETKLDLKQFVTEQGNFIEGRWRTIYPGQRIRFKVGDRQTSSILRKKDKIGPLVGDGSKLRLQKCFLECYVYRDDVDIP